MKPVIRRVDAHLDAEGILDLYRPFILNSHITFENLLPSLEEFRTRIDITSAKHPYLVYESDGKILAYAYANVFRERAAYNWCKELSVYCDEQHGRKGIASALYVAIMEVLKAQNMTKAIGVIALPNQPSIAMHQKLGFHQVGVFKKVGNKFHQWWDVDFWEKDLCLEGDAKEIIPLEDISDKDWAKAIDLGTEKLRF